MPNKMRKTPPKDAAEFSDRLNNLMKASPTGELILILKMLVVDRLTGANIGELLGTFIGIKKVSHSAVSRKISDAICPEFGIDLELAFSEGAKEKVSKAKASIELQSYCQPYTQVLSKFYEDMAVSFGWNNDLPDLERQEISHSIENCPYRGLSAFRKEDASFFFGRENFIQILEKAIQKKPLVAIVGNSGTGKSSVIFAGLIPSLDKLGIWNIASFRPTNNPFYGLAKALLELFEPDMDTLERVSKAKQYADDFKNRAITLKDILEFKLQEIPSKQRFLIVIDQFEELYTLSWESERNLFLDQLLEVIEIESKKRTPDVILVTSLRADFYGYALSHPSLGKALQKWKPENLLKMNLDELKEAIEKPAQLARLKIQDGLITIILNAIKNNQGELPLLEFTLEKLWQKRSNGQLTISAYDQIGGVEKALANHAEDVYKQLNEEERKQAKHIFTQLVCFGQNTDDTRRLATSKEIGEVNWKLVTKLAGSERDLEARLVITGYDESEKQPTVEVVHEALIRGWERLRNWMEEDREFREWQDRLRAENNVWENSDKDSSALLRGALLVEAEDWLKQKSESITDPEEIGFILASRQYQEQEDIERIKDLLNLSQKELQLKQQLNSLVVAVKAGIKLRNIQEPSEELKRNVVERLQQGSYEISEQNQLGHTREVNGVAFSPDGLMIASVSDDRTVKLWESDGKPLKTLEGHTDDVLRVSFSPDGQRIASASGDRTVKLWNVEGKLLRTLEGHTDRVYGVSFSPDGQWIASTGVDRTVRLWSVEGELLRILEGHTDRVYGVSFSPDGQRIASASFDRTVRLWSVEGELLRTLEGHTDRVYEVSFSPDGQQIASTGVDRTVRLWSVEGKLLRTLEGHTDRVWGVSFSPDGQRIASASVDRTVRLWNVEGKLLQTLEGHTDHVYGVCFSPDGQRIASASSDRTVRLWSTEEKLLQTLEGHSNQVYGVSFSPDGQRIASAGFDRIVRLWNVEGKLLQTLEGHTDRIHAVSFSPDGQLIASTGSDKTVRLWSIDGQQLQILEGHTDQVWGVSFSPDGQRIASASLDRTVRLWSIDGQQLQILEGHTDQVWGVSFSPDGQRIASASLDRTVRLWSIDGQQLQTLEGHNDRVYGVSFSSDGQMVASASGDRTVKLWSIDGQLLRTLEGHTDRVHRVSFSPNGQSIASSSADRTVRLWNIEGHLLRTLEGHIDQVWEVSFRPDTQMVASASFDRTVKLWNVDPDDLILDLDIKLNNLLKKGCLWISDYLKTNPNVNEGDRNLCDGYC